MSEVKQGLPWTTSNFFNTFEEAVSHRDLLIKADSSGYISAKIRKLEKGFVVKTRLDESFKKTEAKIEEQLEVLSNKKPKFKKGRKVDRHVQDE